MNPARIPNHVRTFILVTLTGTAALLALAALRKPPVWTAVTIEILPDEKPGASEEESAQFAREAPWFIPNQMAKLRSEELLANVAEKLDLPFLWRLPSVEAAVETFDHRLRIQQTGDSARVTLSIRHEDPAVSASVLMRLLESYHASRAQDIAAEREKRRQSWKESLDLSRREAVQAAAAFERAEHALREARLRILPSGANGPENDDWDAWITQRREALAQVGALHIDEQIREAYRMDLMTEALLLQISAFLADRSTMKEAERGALPEDHPELRRATAAFASSHASLTEALDKRFAQHAKDLDAFAEAREGLAITRETWDSASRLLQELRADFLADNVALVGPFQSFRIAQPPSLAVSQTAEDMLRDIVRAPIFAVAFGIAFTLTVSGLIRLIRLTPLQWRLPSLTPKRHRFSTEQT